MTLGVVSFDPAGPTIGTNLRPKRFDIEVYQGDSFKFFLNLKGPEVGEGPTSIDVTGWTGRCEVKDATGVVADSPTVTIAGDPKDGAFLVDFGTTDDIAAGEYRYDVEMTDSGGNVRTFIGGRFTVTEDVTD